MLFDTTFFIDLERELRAGIPGPCAAFLGQHRRATKHVSVVSMGEFAVGAVSAAVAARFFRGYQRLALGRDVALYSGRLQAGLPIELGENDLWIAGTARFHDLPLVSQDGVFDRVPGLRLLQYR